MLSRKYEFYVVISNYLLAITPIKRNTVLSGHRVTLQKSFHTEKEYCRCTKLYTFITMLLYRYYLLFFSEMCHFRVNGKRYCKLVKHVSNSK